MEQILEHPVLGQLTFNQQLDWWEANVCLQEDCWVKFCLSVEESGIDVQTLMNRGVGYLNWIRQVELQCRHKIANDLLDTYNNVWAGNEDEDDNEPSLEQMSCEEFTQRISPRRFILYSDGSGIWYYNDGDLFAGHAIEVSVNQDKIFEEAYLAG